MKKIEVAEMENINGGNLANAIKDIACVATGFWPIGTLIAGPTCLGLIIATNM